MEPFLQVRSEVGKLRAVLLHRPGRELEQLVPQYLDEMLFEDIPYLEQMQHEHDCFAEVLRARGSEVYYITELLQDILADGEVRAAIVDRLMTELRVNSTELRTGIQELLSSYPNAELASTLVAGLNKDAVPRKHAEMRLSFYIKDTRPFYIDPLPNMYFSRDTGTVIGERLSINSMKAMARRRESMILQFIAEYHPAFQGAGRRSWRCYDEPDSIEGGDILVLNNRALAIGCSARTSAEAIEALASRLFREDEHIREGIVIQIPFTRAYMHLDTVFTMVDRDAFTIFPGITELLKIFRLTPAESGGINIAPQSDLRSTLCRALDLPAVRLIASGSSDLLTAQREQWNDSTNTFAIAPGVVVTYRRNIVSNAILRDNGIEVVEIAGSELVRGRGGPRCMSMPLHRDPVE